MPNRSAYYLKQLRDFIAAPAGILRKRVDGTLGSGDVDVSEVSGAASVEALLTEIQGREDADTAVAQSAASALAAALLTLASDVDLQALANELNTALAGKASMAHTHSSIANGVYNLNVSASGETTAPGTLTLPVGASLRWGSQQVQEYEGVLYLISYTGQLNFRVGGVDSRALANGWGIQTTSPQAALHAVNQTPAQPAQILQGAPGQSAPLLELWQRTAGSAGQDRKAASIDAVLIDPTDATRTSDVVLSTVNQGVQRRVAAGRINNNGAPEWAVGGSTDSGRFAFEHGPGDVRFAFDWDGTSLQLRSPFSGKTHIWIDRDTAAIGFLGAAPVSRPSITGSRESGTALASLLAGLASLGLVTDSTTV